MKKLLTLVLCLALCALPMLGVAEAATDDYLIAADPTGSYGFAYPNTYTLLDKDTISAMLDGIDAESDFGKIVERFREPIESNNLVVLLSEDKSTNINIVAQDAGVNVTADQILASADSLIAQLKASLPGLEITEEASILEQDEFKSVVLGYKYDVNGMTMNGYQGYFCIDTTFFCLTLTGAEIAGQPAQDLGFVMASISML